MSELLAISEVWKWLRDNDGGEVRIGFDSIKREFWARINVKDSHGILTTDRHRLEEQVDADKTDLLATVIADMQKSLSEARPS